MFSRVYRLGMIRQVRLPTRLAARLGFAALAFIFAASVNAQVPEPQQGSASGDLLSTKNYPASTRPVFEFHSAFWVNLHHFLYEQARLSENEPTLRVSGANSSIETSLPSKTNPGPDPEVLPVPLPERLASASQGNPAVSADWLAAVRYYAANLAHRDLLFDDGMVMINTRLAELDSCADLSGKSAPACASGFRPAMIQALEKAAPVYRQLWWPQHDQLNHEWIAAMTPLLRGLGRTLAAQLASVYQSPWPIGPIRVDVVSYGGPFGAYTTLDPTHIIISSANSNNQGPWGFEVLFHEASHSLSRSVENGIIRECRARDIPIPRDLWHALLFYTTGELVKRAFANQAASHTPASPAAQSYMPYAYRNGLYQRGWQDYERVLQAYWQPYLDGKTDFDHALGALVAGL